MAERKAKTDVPEKIIRKKNRKKKKCNRHFLTKL